MNRVLPAAALLLALGWSPGAEAAVVTPDVGPDFAAASASADRLGVPNPDDDPAPTLSDRAGSAASVPATAGGPAPAALLAAPPAALPVGGLPVAPLPDRCLRPQLFPGGLYRPPKGA